VDHVFFSDSAPTDVESYVDLLAEVQAAVAAKT
jgi:hypothetical protein